MAAMALPERRRSDLRGHVRRADGGANLAGHVLSATVNPVRHRAVWSDLTLNPVTNDSQRVNAYGLDISSIFIDSARRDRAIRSM